MVIFWEASTTEHKKDKKMHCIFDMNNIVGVSTLKRSIKVELVL